MNIKLLALASLGMLVSQPASATAIDVQFAGQVAQTGAALIGSTGDIWNQIVPGTTGSGQPAVSGSTLSMLTTSGAASGLLVSFSAPGAYTASSDAFGATSDAKLMQGYLLGTSGSNISITIAGLAPFQAYSLFIYTQGDHSSAGRSSTLTVNGETTTDTQTNASTFISGNNYFLFQGTASTLGTIIISDSLVNTEADLNGFQLLTGTSVPEPATWLTMIAGFGMMGLALRRRRNAGVAYA